MKRLIVGLEPDTDWRSVADQLCAAGAIHVEAPREELPDVVVASFPAECADDDAVAKALAIDGVAYAEPDSFQFAL